MTPPTITGTGGTSLADDVRLDAPELAVTLDTALAELLDEPAPAPDARLASLLATGQGTAAASVVSLPARRRPTARRMAIGGCAVAGALLATTGLAAAAVLPAPVQRAVAAAASRVGIDLPSPASSDDVVVAVDRIGSTVPALVPTSDVATTSTAAPGSAALPTAPPPATAAVSPPATVRPQLAAFGAAVAEFRRCVAAGPDPAACSPPDPAAYGLAPSAEPADLAAFRRAVVAYVACLRSGAGDAARTGQVSGVCERPRPVDFGIVGPRPTIPGPPTVAPPPTRPAIDPGLEAFRRSMAEYAACLRAATSKPAPQRPCVMPEPGDFGLPGWPNGVPIPPRPAPTDQAPPSSPPVTRIPPAPVPGVTVAPPPRPGDAGTTPPSSSPPSTRPR